MRVLLTLVFCALLLLDVRDYSVLQRLQAHGTDPMAKLGAGLAQLGMVYRGSDHDGLILAAAPGCEAPLAVGFFAIDGGENQRFAPLLTPATQPLYIYLGQSRARFSRWDNAFLWVRATVGMVAGWRHETVPRKMVVVVLPKSCPELRKLDWSSLSPWT